MNILDIPLRLSTLERTYLQVILASLSSSQYTSKVDIRTSNKRSIMQQQLQEFISSTMGLLFAAVSNTGSIHGSANKSLDEQEFLHLKKRLTETFQEKNIKYFLPTLVDMIEVARRYKIMNPQKMRVEYGKMVHLLMDAKIFKFYDLGDKPILTVHRCVKQYKLEKMILDKRIDDITSVNNKNKEEDYKKFIEEYATSDETKEIIERILLSIGDAQSYIHQSVEPLNRMLVILRDQFQNEDSQRSLAIRPGVNGAKLSHDHSTQYKFVYQSLLLWKKVMVNMYTLSIASEADLFSNNASSYSLVDTGQGLNRIQPAHQVGRHMSRILESVREEAGRWVGLSVVHLGDRDVPNALVFIDKYRQIPGIINPILITLDQISRLYKENDGIRDYINSMFGSADKLKIDILRDFFRHAFDGSGSNGGSCIDGRLTSSWNWGSKIAKKPFYPIFLLTGFQSFDGDWSS